MSTRSDLKNLNQDSRNILAFHRGYSLEGIELDFTIETLEEKFDIEDYDYIDGCHNFVQWCLPTARKSQYNPDAPVVHQELIDFLIKYKNTLFVNQFITSIEYMLTNMIDFYDSYFRGFYIMPVADHNYLRITRCIECMQLFEIIFDDKTYLYIQNDIMNLINNLFRKPFASPETRVTLIKYWTEAMGENFIEL